MTVAEALAVFVGIPALVVFLVAAAIFGGDWVAWLWGRRSDRTEETGGADKTTETSGTGRTSASRRPRPRR